MNATNVNLMCYRTNAEIPLAMLIPGLKTGALRLGSRDGQVCVAKGPSPFSGDEVKARRDWTYDVNRATLESIGATALLKAWNAAKKSPEPWVILAAAMPGAAPAPAPAVVAPAAKPAKPAKPATKAPTAPVVFSLDSEPAPAPAAKPVRAAAPIAATLGAPVVLDADTVDRLSDLSAVVRQLGAPVTLAIGPVTFEVRP